MAEAVPSAPVTASGVERLRADLETLAYDLRWTWHREAAALFEALDPPGWAASGQNPVLVLRRLSRAQWRRAAGDSTFGAAVTAVLDEFRSVRSAPPPGWLGRNRPGRLQRVAIFAAEVGLADCLPISAGGLGAVVGEELKTASDLGLSFVGVALRYGETSHQWLDDLGSQRETWEPIHPDDAPLALARNRAGVPIELAVELPDGRALVRIWRAVLGRSRLLLLDTDVPGNSPAHRAIVQRLYPSDPATRLAQYVVLGIGGYRALELLGVDPGILHLNEGHTAFAALARVGALARDHGLDLAAARVAAAPSLVFTTHTPVPAGHDYFPRALALPFLATLAPDLGAAPEALLALGRYHPEDTNDTFCPTVLGLRLAGGRNGVSRLHGRVTRQMWRGLWPRVPVDEVPIGHVTNGVHLRSWASPEMDGLLGSTLGPTWRRGPVDPTVWPAVRDLPDEDVWAVRNRQRERMVAQARQWLGVQAARRAYGARVEAPATATDLLDPDALTLGFVGRFVAYKRPTLFLTDRDRLARLLGDDDRPVQIVFAGRAHPTDYAGKQLLRAVVSFARESGLGHRLVFLEDFDIAMDQWLSQGVDVWLNTPRRPDEACGIAGMKSGINGALNFSTLDGWWDEAWTATATATTTTTTTIGPPIRTPGAPPIGWVIGRAEPYDDHAVQDLDDATSFYDTLERDIIPTFYERDADGIPRRWLASVKESLATLGPLWTSDRMVREYMSEFYGPGVARQARLTPRGYSAARNLAAHLDRLRTEWRSVRVEGVTLEPGPRGIEVRAAIALGTLGPGDVVVEVWVDDGAGHGRALEAALVPGAAGRDGVVPYARVVPADAIPAGSVVAVRVLAAHAALDDPRSTGLIAWSDGVEFPAGRRT